MTALTVPVVLETVPGREAVENLNFFLNGRITGTGRPLFQVSGARWSSQLQGRVTNKTLVIARTTAADERSVRSTITGCDRPDAASGSSRAARTHFPLAFRRLACIS